MKIKCVIFDLDGTLLHPDTNLALPSSLKAIQQLKDKGIKVAIATGRSHYAIGTYLQTLNFDFIISCCGGLLFDNVNKKIIDTHYFDIKDTQTMIDIAKKYNHPLCFKFDDAMYLYQNPENIPWLQQQLTDGSLDTNMFKFNIFDRHLHGQTQPLASLFYCSYEDIKMYQQNTTLTYIDAGKGGWDVTATSVNKACGLQPLCDYLNIKKDEIMYFGDHYNDESMFDALNYPVAMGNAVKVIKDKAYYVTDSCNNDGIYNALKHFNIID